MTKTQVKLVNSCGHSMAHTVHANNGFAGPRMSAEPRTKTGQSNEERWHGPKGKVEASLGCSPRARGVKLIYVFEDETISQHEERTYGAAYERSESAAGGGISCVRARVCLCACVSVCVRTYVCYYGIAPHP